MDTPLPKPANPSRRRINPVPQGRRSELTRQVLESQVLPDAYLLQHTIRTGAHWFYWVAGLSLVNSIVALVGGHFVFLAGLAISQVADVVAAHLGFVGPYFSLGIDLVVAVFVCGFGYLASQGSRVALVIGMTLYALDGLIFLRFSAYLPALFHAFVLYQIAQGWRARRQLDELRAASPTLAAAEAAGRDPTGD